MGDNIVWQDLDGESRYSPDALASPDVPARTGVYAWYRDDAAVYVDAAQSLSRRLQEIDIGGRRARAAPFRLRVRGYLAQTTGRCPRVIDEAEIDTWIRGCRVAWIVCGPLPAAKANAQRLAGARSPILNRWYPRPGEDGWLLAYLKQLGGPERAGRCYVEVPIGGPRYGAGAGVRRIDAVLLPGVTPGDVREYDTAAFRADIQGQDVEIIEVKRELNRPVIGQLVAARDLSSLEWEGHRRAHFTAVCQVEDPALEGVCRRLGISVVYVEDPC